MENNLIPISIGKEKKKLRQEYERAAQERQNETKKQPLRPHVEEGSQLDDDLRRRVLKCLQKSGEPFTQEDFEMALFQARRIINPDPAA